MKKQQRAKQINTEQQKQKTTKEKQQQKKRNSKSHTTFRKKNKQSPKSQDISLLHSHVALQASDIQYVKSDSQKSSHTSLLSRVASSRQEKQKLQQHKENIFHDHAVIQSCGRVASESSDVQHGQLLGSVESRLAPEVVRSEYFVTPTERMTMPSFAEAFFHAASSHFGRYGNERCRFVL